MFGELVHIGFGNILAMNRVIAIASPNSAPTKRIIQEARNKGQLIDMTSGRRTKAVIFTDSGHIVLAALAPRQSPADSKYCAAAQLSNRSWVMTKSSSNNEFLWNREKNPCCLFFQARQAPVRMPF